jgi:hypothetical protein
MIMNSTPGSTNLNPTPHVTLNQATKVSCLFSYIDYAYIVPQRKLEDVIESLDSAVGSSSPERPPAKRAHTSRSLYSTLAKYGIKTKDSNSLVT